MNNVDYTCAKCQLHLYKEAKNLYPNEYPDMTLNHLMVKLLSWSFGINPRSLKLGVVVATRVPSINQIERLTCLIIIETLQLFVLPRNTW